MLFLDWQSCQTSIFSYFFMATEKKYCKLSVLIYHSLFINSPNHTPHLDHSRVLTQDYSFFKKAVQDLVDIYSISKTQVKDEWDIWYSFECHMASWLLLLSYDVSKYLLFILAFSHWWIKQLGWEENIAAKTSKWASWLNHANYEIMSGLKSSLMMTLEKDCPFLQVVERKGK